MEGLRAGALVALAGFAVVCAACGGGTAETSREDGTSASAAESGSTTVPEPEGDTTTVPEPEAAVEQPDDSGASDPDDGAGGDNGVVAVTTVPEPQNAAPTVGVIAASEVAAGEAATVDLSSFFGDPDGDELAYEAASSDAAVAVVTVSGSDLSIEGAGEGAATVTVTARDPGGLSVEQSFDVTVVRFMRSLEVADIEPLTALGETRQLSVSANYSDGTNEAVDAALVEWVSSDSAVVEAFDGEATAVGAGNATLTGFYAQHSVEAAVFVRISTHDTGTVRLLYAAPADREFRADYTEAIEHALVDVQSWYRQQLGGLTFSLYDVTPEHCQMDMPADFYVPDSWDKVVEGIQHCAPVAGYTSEFVWVVYADVGTECDDPNSLGRGGPGLTVVGRDDLEGLVGNRLSFYDECGHGPFDGPVRRWVGGMGHELGHALSLPHPPGCDQGLPTCDTWALLQNGYESYPDTYLRVDDKEALIRSPFIDTRSSSGSVPAAAPAELRVRGSVSGSGSSPINGARVSLVGEDFWAWAATSADGTFEIAVPDGSAGSAVVSVHANETASCRWLGYYDDSGALTALQQHAQPFDIGGFDISDVDVALPASPDEMCRGQRTITGTVLDPNAEPVADVWVGHHSAWEWTLSRSDGTFEIRLPEGTSGPSVVAVESPECGHLGYYGPEGLTTQYEQAAQVETGGVDIPGLLITLPASVDELCGQQDAQ